MATPETAVAALPAAPGRGPRDDAVPRIHDLLLRYGAEAASVRCAGPALRHWLDAPPPEGTGACVCYADTGRAWVAAGSPLAPDPLQARAAARFVAAAREAGRRACFFAVERRLPGLRSLAIGEQPAFAPAEWLSSGARSGRIREQLRRSRRKGVRVRRVPAADLREGTPLRTAVERIAAGWAAARRMEPLGFLVALDPFRRPGEHRYYVAERDGEPVAFLSAVPLYARRGWLVEDLLRSAAAPNGTTEQLLVAFAREAGDSAVFTLGLAPLSSGGHLPAWQRAARALARPFYDFAGIRAFKERLHPTRWEPVWLAFPGDGPAALHVGDALAAFAGGSPARIALRTFLRRPAGPPWLISVMLVGWTAALGALAAAGRPEPLGLDRAQLGLWALFDALLAALLFGAARRPRPGRLALAAGLALADGVLYLHHLAGAAPPDARLTPLRAIAAASPLAAAAALAWAALLAARLRPAGVSRRSRRRRPPPGRCG